MTDDRGRLFGAVNLIDGLLLIFVLAIVPVGYVAYRVFRVPTPRIDSIEPASQQTGPNLRLRIHGRDLRPYLRVWVNKTGEPFSITLGAVTALEATFQLETATVADGVLPANLPPGQYDLYLYDASHELEHRVAAFTIAAPPVASVDAVVRFGVDETILSLLKTGDRDGHNGTAGGGATLGHLRPLTGAATSIDVTVGGLVVHVPARLVDAEVSIPAERTTAGVWEYRGRVVRPGEAFVFETDRYTVAGLVVEVRAR